ncbi:hypothetical protein, unknown function [Leishmania tarentolae]|uniref:Nudix hydrolase domain-containing protein n=1 Tax=Leishmania tarentolae TaxID=5689 RepID=A0A640KES6_LEITA|nr:hypothetical protein, unknown function [Leishmania tarentolae]
MRAWHRMKSERREAFSQALRALCAPVVMMRICACVGERTLHLSWGASALAAVFGVGSLSHCLGRHIRRVYSCIMSRARRRTHTHTHAHTHTHTLTHKDLPLSSPLILSVIALYLSSLPHHRTCATRHAVPQAFLPLTHLHTKPMSSKLKVAVPRLASTVLLLARSPKDATSHQGNAMGDDAAKKNDIHVLMMKRHGKARFMPGMYVFPGGGVESRDYATAQHYLAEHYDLHVPDASRNRVTSQDFIESHSQLSTEEAEVEAWACRVGALRELAEEAGCVLGRDRQIFSMTDWIKWQKLLGDMGATGGVSTGPVSSGLATPPPMCDFSAVSSLRPVARWVTPRQSKYRYDTYFYAALVDSALVSEAAHSALHASSFTRAENGEGMNAGKAARCIPPQELPLLEQASEVSELLWVSPLEALQRHEDLNDTFSLATPTYLLLHALSLQPSFASMAAAWAAAPPSPAGPAAKPLGDLPYSSALPCVEPLNTMTDDGRRIMDVVLPTHYFHETGWSLADGAYLFPGECSPGRRHFVHLFVGCSGMTSVDGATADKACTILH